MLCLDCGRYYRKDFYNNTSRCHDCGDHDDGGIYHTHDELQDELDRLRDNNGSHTTKPIFYE